jgi:tetratricopeptide (TPR) repeat protein
VALVVALLGVGAGAWYWLRPVPPVPPNPDLTGIDPEVAEAVRAARAGVEKAPRAAPAWGRYGMVLRAHDFEPESNTCFAEAERLDPREPRWPYLHGMSVVIGDPDAGIPLLQKGVEQCHDNPLDPRLRLAEVLLDNGRPDEAEAHLQRARKLDPGNGRVELGLARLALERGEWREAVEHLDLCLEDPGARKKAYQLRSIARNRLGEPQRARQDVEKAAELPADRGWPDPFVTEVLRLRVGVSARMERAGELFRDGRQAEAIALMNQLVKDRPESAEAWNLLGSFLEKVGEFAAAEQVLERQAANLAPDNVEVWFNLGVAKFALTKWQQAADCFRKAIRIKPDHAVAHYNLGHCHKKLGDREAAAEEFRLALHCRPDYVQAEEALREVTAPPPKSP